MPQRAAEQFSLQGQILDIRPYGHGLINDTYLITTAEKPGRAILQRINRRVFPNPVLIMENVRTLLDHVQRGPALTGDARRALRLPGIATARDGKDYYLDTEGGFWRVLSFIDNTCCIDRLAHLDQAQEVGFAIGRFHALSSGLDPGQLHDTLPGFHITPRYLTRFLEVAALVKRPSWTPELRFCFAFIEERQQRAGALEQAKRQGRLALRPIHGDPKLNNILFDEQSGLAVSLIDLDTVKPGLIHYDIGDCLRSCCNSAGECPKDGAAIEFDLDICRAILKGYFAEARSFLSGYDYTYLYEAMRLIPFELGLRFLTDYLDGNGYFKVDEPEQNLHRALVQFQLTACIERKESRIKHLVSELSKA